MKKIIYLLITIILITGCAQKEFEPKNPISKTLPYKKYKELYDYTKTTETFGEKEYRLIGKNKIVYFDSKGRKLGNFKKINTNLAANANKLLLINEKKVIKLPQLVFRATQKGKKIAIVFENNAFGVYSLKKNKLVFYQKDDDVVSTKYLSADPIFYQDLILFPLISGKIAIVDAKTNSFIRNLDISDEFILDNIIFLKIVNNNLFMATPKKLVLFNPNFLIDYKSDIKHIIDDGKYLYIFNVDGSIVKMDTNLKLIKKIKLPFADYFAPGICKGNIYTITSNGYLLKISPDLNVTVYKTGEFETDEPLRIRGCKIYNDNKVFFIE